MDLSKGQPSTADQQVATACRATRSIQKSPGVEGKASHDGQESDGTRPVFYGGFFGPAEKKKS